MSARVRIIRVLGNPKKKRRAKMRARKNKRPRKSVRRRESARRRPGRFLVEGFRIGGRLDYLTRGGSWGHRSKAHRFTSTGEAQRAMHEAAPGAEKLGFSHLQVVLA